MASMRLNRRQAGWTARVWCFGAACMVTLGGAVGVALAATSPPAGQMVAGQPTEGFVETSAGRLQYLDWGGSGPAVVLLAGLGNTAHVFEDFAPRLADTFHVVGLTRRGFGASARPDSGYDTQTLARDIADALEQLGLREVALVGHSLAGDEITRFAAQHPERVRSIVYLDAAYDRAAMRKQLAVSLFTNPKPPAPPRAGKRDKGSIRAYGDYVERVYGVRWPDAEIRATRRFDSDGRPSADGSSPGTNAKILLGAKSPDYRAVRAPALAIYAIQDSIEEAYPWLREPRHGMDAVLGAVAVATRKPVPVPTLNAWNWFRGRWRPFVESQKEKFAAEIPDGTIRELHGPHYIFLSHPDEVASAVRSFLTRGTD